MVMLTEEELLTKREGAVLPKLSFKQHCLRERTMKWLVEAGKGPLQLKLTTIQLSLRLFDFFCLHLPDTMRSSLLSSLTEMHLVLISCLFSCSKYCEIYPPCINDFTYVCSDRFTRQDIIAKETQIVLLTNCAFTLTTVSLWYEHLFREKMPDWGYRMYPKLYWVSTRDIAKAVRRVEKEEFPEEGTEVTVALKALGVKDRGESQAKDGDSLK